MKFVISGTMMMNTDESFEFFFICYYYDEKPNVTFFKNILTEQQGHH